MTSWAGQVLLSDLCHVSVLGSGEETVLCFPVASIRLTIVPHPCGCAKRAMEANLQLLVAMTVILLSNQKCLEQKRSWTVPTSLLGKVLWMPGGDRKESEGRGRVIDMAAQAIIPRLLPVCCVGVTRSRSVALLISFYTMAQQLGHEATRALHI